MICPKMCAIEGKGPALERHPRQVSNGRRLLARIEPRDLPSLISSLGAAQNIENAIDKGMPTDLRADLDRTQDVAAIVEFENPPLIPLAEVEMLAIEAQVRTGVVGTCDPSRVGKALGRNEAADKSIVF